MNFIKRIFYISSVLLLTGCIGSMNPTGGNSTPNYPYYITIKPLVIKKILIPAGTKLVYEEQFFKEGEQNKMLSEEKLTDIELPAGKTQNWAGVPITSISKFFNSEMRGYTVNADFSKLSPDKKTKLSTLWESCSDGLGITIKNTDDWSFNMKNILDVQSCSVNYQRYFKDNPEQQLFLNTLYAEMKKIASK